MNTYKQITVDIPRTMPEYPLFSYQIIRKMMMRTRRIKLDLTKKEKVWVKASMGGALIGIGKRNKKLNKEAIKVAKGIGPREITYGDTNCEPLDILKHLTNERLQEKLKST